MQDNIIIFPDPPPGNNIPSVTPVLPVFLTPLVGREQEVQEIKVLLLRQDVRLLTLTGTAGVGKTRLAFEVARELMPKFIDGVHFVSLAPISDPALVIPTIAHSLGLIQSSSQSVLDLLKTSQSDKQRLLLLDNFEHVISSATLLVELLEACPNVKLLITSREVLRLRGESRFAVLPLTVPDLKQLPDDQSLVHIPSVNLFLQRAKSTRSDFHLTADNAAIIAEICLRLDGLPLAIELAAAHVNLFPPRALLVRLEQPLQLLIGGLRDLPERQQTLRNTLMWSYKLLTASEQFYFGQLSVFVGGCTLEAIEGVCAVLDEAEYSLEVVASLLDKSLLQRTEQEEAEPRLTMLETIREYGLERLKESGKAKACQRAHALYYLALAQKAESHLKGAQQVFWWRQLEREQGNLRAALVWFMEQEEGEFALRLSGAQWQFWDNRGYWSEGWHWLETVLNLPQAQERTTWRAKALYGAAQIASHLGNPTRSFALLEESVSLSRELADKPGLALSLSTFGCFIGLRQSTQAARILLEESLALAQEVGDRWILAHTLRNLGYVLYHYGDFKSAHQLLKECVMLYRDLNDSYSLHLRLLELAQVSPITQAKVLVQESLVLARALGNKLDIARVLYGIALLQVWNGSHEQAVELYKESFSLFREQNDKMYMGIILLRLGGIALHQGDLLQAEALAQKCLTLFREIDNTYRMALALRFLGDVRLAQGDLPQAREIYKEGALLAGKSASGLGIVSNLIGLARIAATVGQFEQSAYLFGVIEQRFNPKRDFHPDMDPFDRPDYEHIAEGIHTKLGEEAFIEAWTKGQAMALEQALTTLELQMIPTTTSPSEKVPATSRNGLTTREMEVLRLLVQGLTSAQIAEQLVIGLVTVNSHVRSIYSKLGVTSRAAATRYTLEHHLL